MNSTGREWMIVIMLLCCIVFSNGIVYATGHLVEENEIGLSHTLLSVTETEQATQIASDTHIQGDTVTYSGSKSVFSAFYHPVLLAGTMLGVALLFVVIYYRKWKWREGENR